MTDANLIERAKLGDPQAIEALMNQSLQSRGMRAIVDRRGNALDVVLEAERVPNRQALTTFVQKGIHNLGVQSIASIRILGQQIGASQPAWTHELELNPSLLDTSTDASVVPIESMPDSSNASLTTDLPGDPALSNSSGGIDPLLYELDDLEPDTTPASAPDFLHELLAAEPPADEMPAESRDEGIADFLNELSGTPTPADFPAEVTQDQSTFAVEPERSITDAEFQALLNDSSPIQSSEPWLDSTEPAGDPDEGLLDFLASGSSQSADADNLEAPIVRDMPDALIAPDQDVSIPEPAPVLPEYSPTDRSDLLQAQVEPGETLADSDAATVAELPSDYPEEPEQFTEDELPDFMLEPMPDAPVDAPVSDLTNVSPVETALEATDEPSPDVLEATVLEEPQIDASAAALPEMPLEAPTWRDATAETWQPWQPWQRADEVAASEESILDAGADEPDLEAEIEEIPPDFLQDFQYESSEASMPEVSDRFFGESSVDSVPDAALTSSSTSLEAEIAALELVSPPGQDQIIGEPEISAEAGTETAPETAPEAIAPNPTTSEAAGVADLTPVMPSPEVSQDRLEEGLGDFREGFVEPLPPEFLTDESPAEQADWRSLQEPLDLESPDAEANYVIEDDMPDYTPPPLPPTPGEDSAPESQSSSWLFYTVLIGLVVLLGGLLGFSLLWSKIAPSDNPPETEPSVAPSPAEPAPTPTSANPTRSTTAENSLNANNLALAIDRASNAVTLSQAAQSVDDWGLVASKWQQAIALLKAVPTSSSDYATAQQKLTEYQANLVSAQQKANQPIVAAVPLGSANIANQPSPSASIASPTTTPFAAIACDSVAPTTQQPVELNNVQFDPAVDQSQASPIVGCITNHTQQPIASVDVAYQSGSNSTATATPATGKLSFSPLEPQKTVSFKSEFTIAPETQDLTIASILWTAAGSSDAKELPASISVTRSEKKAG